MMWQDQLCQVRFEFLDGKGDERERLEHAAGQFYEAFPSRAEWPVGLRQQAESLYALLYDDHSQLQINVMNEEKLREVSQGLWQFCEFAEPCAWDDGAGIPGGEHP